MTSKKNKKKKICFVLVNRANYGRVKSLIQFLKKEKNSFEIQIIVVSSPLLKKYGNLEKILIKDGLKPTEIFYTHIEGENLVTMTKSTALVILELASSFGNLNPDIVFTVGDRYEALATALTARYMNIFLCHLQGGEITGSIDESVRHAITKLANLHLVSTEKSKKRVMKMGENPKYVFNVGCPSIDIIKKINFKKNCDLSKYNFGVGYKVDTSKPYYLVLFHPVTTSYKENIKNTEELYYAVKKLDEQVIWIWPNSDAGSNFITRKIRSFREGDINVKDTKINFYTNFEVDDYLKLIKNTKCLIGNSSSGIRESSFLKVPVVNIGIRQFGRERGKNVIDVKNKSNDILRGVKKIINKKITKSTLYGRGNANVKIIKILKKIPLKIEKNFYE